MLRAAKQLEPLDIGLARETYLEAFTARCSSAAVSRPVGTWPEPHVWRRAPSPGARPPICCSWTAWRCCHGGYAVGTPALRRALLASAAGHLAAGGD